MGGWVVSWVCRVGGMLATFVMKSQSQSSVSTHMPRLS